MKRILLISMAAAGLLSGVAQAAPAVGVPALSGLLAPASTLGTLPALPTTASLSSSRPLGALYPLINNQALANLGRVGSSLLTGPLNLPLLGTPLSGFFGKVNNVIVGSVKIGPPQPPKNDPASN